MCGTDIYNGMVCAQVKGEPDDIDVDDFATKSTLDLTLELANPRACMRVRVIVVNLFCAYVALSLYLSDGLLANGGCGRY